MDIKNLSTPQLQRINTQMDAFLFKEAFSKEPWDKNFEKYPAEFTKLMNSMSTYKRQLMTFFTSEYQNRFQLINQNAVKADEFGWDGYFYTPSWVDEEDKLAQLLEQQNSLVFDLGVVIIGLGLGASLDYSSVDDQKSITLRAQLAAKQVMTTTQTRAKAAVQAALDLGENRSELDTRLQKVFVNPYRGAFIAQDQALRSYFYGKEGSAVDVGLTLKTWLGAQAKDLLCGNVSGITVPINALFPNGLPGPLAHFGCRCDIIYS